MTDNDTCPKCEELRERCKMYRDELDFVTGVLRGMVKSVETSVEAAEKARQE